jgi:quercetin dioxygenase-like cupin family protein
MNLTKIFSSSHFMQPSNDEPLRTVVEETNEAVIIAWHLKPGQKILPHIHPRGQDTWTILAGCGHYYLDQKGTMKPIKAGDIAIARTNDVHGVLNSGMNR